MPKTPSVRPKQARKPASEPASAGPISQDEVRARIIRLDEEYRKSRNTGGYYDLRDDPKWGIDRVFP